MLAVDQREALRAMMADQRGRAVQDAEVTAFKLDAIRTLTPYASAVLLDKQFVLDQALEQGAVYPGCGLIAAGDRFVPGADELVTDAVIDADVDLEHYAAAGAVAAKLLVVWRPDEDPQRRVDMVRTFVSRARGARLISIIEPVSRAPRDARPWDWDAGVLAAARELGDLGADLYKAEVPRHGEGDEAGIRRGCAEITEAVASPWVVLSSGVADEVFPRAVELAMREGASGFLAGRAVWRACLAADDVRASLGRDAVARLRRLCEVVDRIAGEW
ncbi:aldolase [Streptomyces oryzae]|uniref:Aldolase n=2 Tax=Streptomyces oryzae TaxID=1434886 RepID=A0ABS3XAA7_9ACTN|nr:aldolase [Streptomyces oryzae]